MSTKTEFKHNTAVADEIDEALLRQSPWDDGSFISEIDVIVEDDGLTEDDEWSQHLDDREVWVCGAESVTFSSIDDWWDDVQRRLVRFDEGMEEWGGYDDDHRSYESVYDDWYQEVRDWLPEDEYMTHREMCGRVRDPWDGPVTGWAIRYDDDDVSSDDLNETYWNFQFASIEPEELPDDLAARDSAKAKHLVLEAVVAHDRHSLRGAINHAALEYIECAWLGKYTLLELLGEDVWNLYAAITCYDYVECYDDMGFPM